MSVEEDQSQKVIVQATRCVHYNGHEHNRIWKIGVQPVVVKYSLPNRVFQNTVDLRIVIGGECMCELSKLNVRSCHLSS